ncbi:MFS transporter [Streptomyces sp. NPDC001339]|uniref:MFS transporter n=1 Tax=Streptomyces sp. NPDC001339 TaxID=3364563 RepID=UPI0036982EA8
MTAAPARRRLPVVLRNRAFGTVWAAQVLTQAASRMFQVGVVWWLVAHAVGSGGDRGLASGVFLAVSTLPAVALAPLVATVIARCRHRTVLASAAALAGLVAAATAGWTCAAPPPMAVAYGAALLLAGCQALFDPCLTTSVPELVDDADIEEATGFELATQSLAGLAGGLLGPLIVDAWDLAGIVSGCAGAYLAAAVLVSVTRFPRGATGAGGADPADGVPPRRTLRQILADHRFIRRVLLCFAAANVFTTAVYVVMPLYTRSVLHAQGSTVAALEAALGIGTLLGSFTGARLRGSATTVGGACLALMAAALGTPGLFPDRTAAIGALVVAGWCVGAIGVRFVALFQRLVPAEDKPGFFAMMQALLGATFPLSSLVFGALGDHLSPQVLCLLQAVGLVPVAAALWWSGRRAGALPEAASAAPAASGSAAPAKPVEPVESVESVESAVGVVPLGDTR